MFESKPRAAVEKKESSTETGTSTRTLTPYYRRCFDLSLAQGGATVSYRM